MRILVTGAFGNIGRHAVHVLAQQGHEVTCFGRKTRARAKAGSAGFGCEAEIIWGDVSNAAEIKRALKDQNVIIHLAAVMPPASEKDPKAAFRVNVDGTQNLIEAARALPVPPLFIYASTVCVYGADPDRKTLLTVDDPVRATDVYTLQKIACEEMIKSSGLPWVILRISSAGASLYETSPAQMFCINLDARIEFVHPDDVAHALSACINNTAVYGKTLLIGGGASCRMYYRDMMRCILDCIGCGMLPEQLFSQKAFSIDWIDTTESEALLHYQKKSFDDFLADLRKLLGWRIRLTRIMRPLVRWLLIRSAPKFK